MATLKQFSDKLLSDYSSILTDQVFLLIQDNSDLMHGYLKLVERHGLTTVNQSIAKSIKQRFQLDNLPSRRKNPKSTLIQSHRKFR